MIKPDTAIRCRDRGEAAALVPALKRMGVREADRFLSWYGVRGTDCCCIRKDVRGGFYLTYGEASHYEEMPDCKVVEFSALPRSMRGTAASPSLSGFGAAFAEVAGAMYKMTDVERRRAVGILRAAFPGAFDIAEG